jgi:23S rRNA (adenine2030-N6)-methyltransferase
MLSYQHGFHAGSFADIVKHLVLINILSYCTKKENPFFYLDTHAGKGFYNLKSNQAAKTKEYSEGIEALWNSEGNPPAALSAYLSLVKLYNSKKDLKFYPGSPLLAAQLLRDQDRLVCCELHPSEYQELVKLSIKHPQYKALNTEGMHQISALLPPREKRGLIFIDPSYELKEDYKAIPRDIHEGLKRFSTGIYCLWYPILREELHEPMIRALKRLPGNNHLKIEFILDKNKPGMYGCGLWVINPPYLLAQEINEGLRYLTQCLNKGLSHYSIE